MSAIGDLFAEPRCDGCGGIVVPETAWLTMPEPTIRTWIGRQAAEMARARLLKPGDPIPSPLICRCQGDPLVAAIDRLRADRG